MIKLNPTDIIKENKELNIALEKSYVEKYLISQDSKFFKDINSIRV